MRPRRRNVLRLVLAALAAACLAAPARAQQPPPSARFVASSHGTVYYPVTCDAWRDLSPDNLRFFPSAEAAQAAGYTLTRSRACRTSSGPPPSVCTVATIVDGDTLVCEGGERIRLLLVDAPESDQSDFGLRSKLALEELLAVGARARVELDVQERDRYGRVLAHLYAPDGTWVNRALVRRGYAVPLVYPPNVRHVEAIRAAADSARAERRGLWEVDAFDCLPVDFRAGRCGGVR